jgi:hypothetical protein
MLTIETVRFKGWNNNIRLSNGSVELIVTGDVGPRIIRCGFVNERNLMAEFKEQLGGTGEKDWMIRGGHRLWIAPESKSETYELDNSPVQIRKIPGGISTLQEPGRLTGIQKTMNIRMAETTNEITITHQLINRGRKPRTLAPWALTVMAPGGLCIIPLPEKIPHTDRLLHNQAWSIWGYTDFADGRWTLGSRYTFFRQSRKHGPGKLGIAHREGWVAYQLDGFVMAKSFEFIEGATYPDGGVNFETFSNERMLEVETLAPLTTLAPGKSVKHVEKWTLLRNTKPVQTEKDAALIARRLNA